MVKNSSTSKLSLVLFANCPSAGNSVERKTILFRSEISLRNFLVSGRVVVRIFNPIERISLSYCSYKSVFSRASTQFQIILSSRTRVCPARTNSSNTWANIIGKSKSPNSQNDWYEKTIFILKTKCVFCVSFIPHSNTIQTGLLVCLERLHNCISSTLLACAYWSLMQ